MNKAKIPLWQTPEWEQFQKALGNKVYRIDQCLLIKYPLFFGWHYGYLPRGPHEINDAFYKELQSLARKKKMIFVKIDPEETINVPKKYKTRPSHSPQPETTLLLDLHLSESDLLKQMKRKGRYNISLAEKKGVLVKRATTREEQQEFASIFYKLLKETTERDGFAGHGEKYYQTMLAELPMSEIFVAFYDAQPISAAICTYQTERAIYYYGASGNTHRELMAPYLIQWEAIKEAKKRGCKSYDFLGIAPEHAPKTHPWKGITEFKTKFGGQVINFPPAKDIIFHPFLYQLYKLVKQLQKIIKK